MSVLGA